MQKFAPAYLLFALAVGLPAFAQTPAPQAPMMNGQGVTRDAFFARSLGRIMAADTDGDGRVSKADFTAAMAGRCNPDRQFARMDTNGDGYLDKAEITAALTARFNRMDANGDGVLSPDERKWPGAGGHDTGEHGAGGGMDGQGMKGGQDPS